MNRLAIIIITALFSITMMAQSEKGVTVAGMGAAVPGDALHTKSNALLRIALDRYQGSKGLTAGPVAKGTLLSENVAVYAGGDGKNYISILMECADVIEAAKLVTTSGGTVETVSGNFITATVPVDAALPLLQEQAVLRMEAAALNKRLMDSAKVSSGVAAVHTGSGLPQAYKGNSVILGVIDSGIDWEHADFKNSTGSRILYLWDMSRSLNPPSGYTYGYEYTKANIDGGQCIETDDFTGEGHGTHVTGIAAGGGKVLAQYTGVAPEADIIFVKGFRSGAYFTDNDVINGCNYIFTKAQALGKPAVINLSLGGHYGPHDGTTLYERMLSNLTGAGKVIVAAAGNSGADNIHLSYAVGGTSYNNAYETKWQIGSESSSSLIDLWYNSGSISVGVAAWGTGGLIGYTNPVPPGSTMQNMMFTVNGITYGRVNIDASTVNNPNNGSKEVLIQIDNVNGAYDLGAVTWTLYTVGSGTFDAWVVNGGNFSSATSGFVVGGDNIKSVSAPSTALKVLSVGSYTSKFFWQSTNGNSYYFWGSVVNKISSFSGMGPSRDGRIKPDITAPGQVIASALSGDLVVGTDIPIEMVLSGNKYQAMQGTSMAAPHVSGVVALMLQRSGSLDYAKVFSILTNSAKKDAFTGTSAGNVYGYGKMNAVAALQATPLSVSNNDVEPRVFSLMQNYPNPFNPETVIEYQLPAGGNTTLQVFDVLGNKVADLVDGYQNAGPHSVTVSVNTYKTLSSGVYFYRLTSSGISITKKLMVLK